MKRRLFILAIAAIAAFPLLAADTPSKPDVKSGSVVEEIIARINNHIITRSEFDRSQQQVQQEGEQQNAPAQEIADKEKKVLRDLVDQQLRLHPRQA